MLGTEGQSQRRGGAPTARPRRYEWTARAAGEGVLGGLSRAAWGGHWNPHSSVHTWGDSVGWRRDGEMGGWGFEAGQRSAAPGWAGQSWACAAKPGQQRRTRGSYGNDTMAGFPRKGIPGPLSLCKHAPADTLTAHPTTCKGEEQAFQGLPVSTSHRPPKKLPPPLCHILALRYDPWPFTNVALGASAAGFQRPWTPNR